MEHGRSVLRLGSMKKKKAFSASTIYMRLSRGKKVGDDPARKGYVPLLVGSEEVMERIMVPTKLIDHPYIVEVLEMSANEYGYDHQGLLKIQYDADCFKRMVEIISKQKQSSKAFK